MSDPVADTRKSHFSRHLWKSLDTLFYLHIVIIYLHDVSTFRLLLRALVHTTCIPVALRAFLQSLRVPSRLPFRLDNYRNSICLILASNLYCILRHAFHSYPQPIYMNQPTDLYSHGFNSHLNTTLAVTDPKTLVTGVLDRFKYVLGPFISKYALEMIPVLHHNPTNVLNGGLTIEFIGEFPFDSCFSFLGLDITVLFIQILMFCMTFEQLEDLFGRAQTRSSSRRHRSRRNRNESNTQNSADDNLEDVQTPNSTNDTQFEESSQQENEEEEGLQLNVPRAPPNTEDTLDSTYSGACIIQNLQISKTLKLLWIQNNATTQEGQQEGQQESESV